MQQHSPRQPIILVHDLIPSFVSIFVARCKHLSHRLPPNTNQNTPLPQTILPDTLL